MLGSCQMKGSSRCLLQMTNHNEHEWLADGSDSNDDGAEGSSAEMPTLMPVKSGTNH